jgi:hypothetical protein
MPNYTYECVKNDGGCGHIFEIYCLIKDYPPQSLRCPKCNLVEYIKRNFQEDVPSTQIPHKTLGSLADKNTSNFSKEAKNNLWKKHNDYRFKQPTKLLPSGMTRMPMKLEPPKPRKKRKANKR